MGISSPFLFGNPAILLRRVTCIRDFEGPVALRPILTDSAKPIGGFASGSSATLHGGFAFGESLPFS